MLVYLNRLRVIHGLTELEMLEVFNDVGATVFKEMLKDRALAVAKPTQQIKVKGEDTVVLTTQEIHKALKEETWDRLLEGK